MSGREDQSSSVTSETVQALVVSQSFGEGSSLQITSHKLNGKKFLQWSQSVLLVIRGRGKIRYITGKFQQPDVNNPTYENWDLNNSIVMAWLINSMESHISRTYLFIRTAKAI
ncbi:UBN2_3 domain-containing protein [Cephalotus follicularis]|uniref:UBN2_3 domain-containing protein n=1 Tax=Cephalotus follicularis TaxID=3775 RepID=A0A1Q3AL95_CEPFO|nr:UBN2_3 domain-containing protein [Cephalotus follicularis]